MIYTVEVEQLVLVLPVVVHSWILLIHLLLILRIHLGALLIHHHVSLILIIALHSHLKDCV